MKGDGAGFYVGGYYGAPPEEYGDSLPGDKPTISPHVRTVFYDFNAQYEGVIACFYQDIKGWVSTGVGNLTDPVALALKLPWKNPDGSLASAETVTAQWQVVKADNGGRNVGPKYYAPLTTIRLSETDLRAMVDANFLANAEALAKRFPGFRDWPADAQLAISSLAWACGTGFKFPKCEAALLAQDFATAALECKINEDGNGGVAPRNKANKLLLESAAQVVASGGDRATLSGVLTIPPAPAPLFLAPGTGQGTPGGGTPGPGPGPTPGGASGGDSGAGAFALLALAAAALAALAKRGRK